MYCRQQLCGVTGARSEGTWLDVNNDARAFNPSPNLGEGNYRVSGSGTTKYLGTSRVCWSVSLVNFD